MQKKRPRVLFVHNSLRSFVETDLLILGSLSQVEELNWSWGWGTPLSFIRLIHKMVWCNIIFGWFASHHTFLPALLGKLMKKKVFICSADYDIANEPSFHYGSMRGGISKAINNLIFSSASTILVTSEFSKQLAITNTVLGKRPDKVFIVPLGFQNVLLPSKYFQKQEWIITVGDVNSENFIRKGHREFINVAKNMLDYRFFLIGRVSPSVKVLLENEGIPPNLTITGYVSNEKLHEFYCQALVYAQLSYMEGFGSSLAEAMLYECVPVISNRGSLPEVVQETGVYAEYGNIDETIAAIENAMMHPNKGKIARERILSIFPLERRIEMIAELIRK